MSFGILIIIFTWTLLVLPSLIIKTNLKKHPLSYIVKHNKLGKLYNFGLVITPITLTFYLFQIIKNSLSILSSIAILVLIGGCLTCIAGSLITMNRSIKTHTSIAKLCFVLYGTGLTLFSLSFDYIQIVLTLIGVIGMFYFAFIKKWSGIAEIWGYLFFSLWLLSFPS